MRMKTAFWFASPTLSQRPCFRWLATKWRQRETGPSQLVMGLELFSPSLWRPAGAQTVSLSTRWPGQICPAPALPARSRYAHAAAGPPRTHRPGKPSARRAIALAPHVQSSPLDSQAQPYKGMRQTITQLKRIAKLESQVDWDPCKSLP
jgi:hypothetical protein